jgi:hypothetical protein
LDIETPEKRKSPAAGEALERNLLEDWGACGFFFGLGLFALFLGQASVFHHAHHEIAVVVLDHGGEGVEGLDGEPLLVDVPAVLDVGLVNGGGLYRLAVLESELFGHVKGSFTGAVKDHKGKFEQADGGTLFLDEIGDMSLSAQAKVLRVLQENKLSRVGSDKDINVKVRVVAATNKNLLEEIAKGNFREDLYHRLSVIVIHVPSLAERKEDIPLLVNHFIGQICSETGMANRAIADDAVAELQKHAWTGNIRELRNVTERLLILGNQTITKEDVQMYASPLFR